MTKDGSEISQQFEYECKYHRYLRWLFSLNTIETFLKLSIIEMLKRCSFHETKMYIFEEIGNRTINYMLPLQLH
jgi:hypothetical protein